MMRKIRRVGHVLKTKIEIASFFRRNSSGKRFILFNTPIQVNMGDQAIAHAEISILKNHYPDIPILEIQIVDVWRNIDYIISKLLPSDVIFIQGGGNVGNLYPGEEKLRLEIVSKIRDNRIISFPQSIFFEDSDNKEFYEEELVRVYSENPNFVLVAREPVSYDQMKTMFPKNKVIHVPDIVLYLAQHKEELHIPAMKKYESSLLSLLRRDKEKLLDRKAEEKLVSLLLEGDKEHYQESDTYLDNHGPIFKEQRAKVLSDFIQELAKYELVITDRLHGMILAYITQTPCLVFKNNNPKITATYAQWLVDCGFIQLVEESEIANATLIQKYVSQITSANRKFVDLDYCDLLDEIDLALV